MEKESDMTCILCNKNDSTIKWCKIYNNKEYTYRKCIHCGLIFLAPLPRHEEVVQAYYEQSSEYYAHKDYFSFLINLEALENKAGRSRTFVKLIEKYCNLAKGKNVSAFDVGAGAGILMCNMREHLGWKVAGIEPGDLGQKAAKKFNLDIKRIAIEDFTLEQKHDVVTLMSVIEHTPQPFAMMQKVRSMLTDNGRLVLEMPNANSLGAYLKKNKWDPLLPPAHMIMYTPNTITSLLEKTGFKTTKIYLTGSYPYIWKIPKLAGWIKKMQLKYQVSLPLMDSMIVFARPIL